MIWKINYVERMKSDGFILQVVWECSDASDGFIGRLTDTIGFDVEAPKVPFNQVTESMIVDWVKDKLGAHEVSRIESTVLQMIETSKQAEKVIGKPWENVEVTNA